jgi:hypothetical protein
MNYVLQLEGGGENWRLANIWRVPRGRGPRASDD